MKQLPQGSCAAVQPPARILRALALAAASLVCVGAFAQDYPSRPIKLVVGLAPGGASDAIARAISKELGERLKQPVIVENKAGAGGNIASEYVAKSSADGYTLLYTADNHILNPLIYKNAGYSAQKDFTGVILVSEYGLLLSTNAGTRYKSMSDLVNLARREPGTIFYGSSGTGLPNHVAMEKFKSVADLQITHVPYKGAGPSVSDAVAGQIPLVMSTIAAAQPFITSGRLVPLMVTGSARWPTLPNVPTVAEAGFPAATSNSWMGIVAPVGTPKPVIDRLNTQIAAILEERSIKDSFLKMGMGVAGGSAERFNDQLARDLAVYQKLVTDINLKVE